MPFLIPKFDSEKSCVLTRSESVPVGEISDVRHEVAALGLFSRFIIEKLNGERREYLVLNLWRMKKVSSAFNELKAQLGGSAYVYWRERFGKSLNDFGYFEHAGIRVQKNGVIVRAEGNASLAGNRYTYELDGGTICVKIGNGVNNLHFDWKAGQARDAIVSVMADIYHNVSKMRTRRSAGRGQGSGDNQQGRIKVRMRNVASIISRHESYAGMMKLNSFLKKYELPTIDPQVLAVAPSLITNKSFIQNEFVPIVRYFEKTRQMERLYSAFEDIIRMAERDAVLSPKQLFAIYEIGLHIDYTITKITAIISAILTGGDPRRAAEREETRAWERSRQRKEDTPQEPFRPYHANPDAVKGVDVPAGLRPMMAVLDIDMLVDAKVLRRAWMTKIRTVHPDTLSPDASESDREWANQATSECNTAYNLLLTFLKSL